MITIHDGGDSGMWAATNRVSWSLSVFDERVILSHSHPAGRERTLAGPDRTVLAGLCSVTVAYPSCPSVGDVAGEIAGCRAALSAERVEP